MLKNLINNYTKMFQKESNIINFINRNKNNLFGYQRIYDNYHNASVLKLDREPYTFKNIDFVDKLMIVAHPDDEVIFGGKDIFEDNGWFAIYCTNSFDRIESVEKTSKDWNFNGSILNFVDSDRKEVYFHKKLYEDLEKIIKERSWKKIITHGVNGEYRHPQHIKVHQIVSTIVSELEEKPEEFKIFNINGPKLNQDLLEKKYFTMTNYYNRHINYPGINNSYSIDFSPKKYDMKYCLCE